MSVLQCDRTGCENIMCDRLSDEYGYLCWECFNELLASGTLDIEKFMNGPRATLHKPNPETYNKIFPRRDQ
jgi:hypothetical protein